MHFNKVLISKSIGKTNILPISPQQCRGAWLASSQGEMASGQRVWFLLTGGVPSGIARDTLRHFILPTKLFTNTGILALCWLFILESDYVASVGKIGFYTLLPFLQLPLFLCFLSVDSRKEKFCTFEGDRISPKLPSQRVFSPNSAQSLVFYSRSCWR